MTSSRPRPAPDLAGTRPRPSDERAQLAADGRTTRRIAVVAVVLALLALCLQALRFALPADASCQQTAWGVVPAAGTLPAGWTVTATQYDVNRLQTTLTGPVPQDDTTAQAVVYVTVTCFPSDAAGAVTRSAQAAKDAGQLVTQRKDLGDDAFVATDDTNASFVQVRRGDVVAYLAASAETSTTEVEALASAYDRALGGDGGAPAVGTPDAGTGSDDLGSEEPLPSDEASGDVPSEAAVAPELEALLPAQVGDTTLTVDSASGADVLEQIESGRAIKAALRAAGKDPSDMRFAQAYDEAGNIDLGVVALSVEGMPAADVRAIAIDSFIGASGAGVKQDEVKLGGRTFTRIDFGDEQALHYVTTKGDAVIIMTTADADLAAAAAAAMP